MMTHEMETIEIYDELEWAIIASFKGDKERVLKRSEIIKRVKESIDKKNDAIIHKINKFKDNEYLIQPPDTRPKSKPKEDSKPSKPIGLYKLNDKKEFVYKGEPLPLPKVMQVSEEARNIHTADLKKDIQAWIDRFPEPTSIYPIKDEEFSSFKINACESLILFSDLKNHLPELGSNVCEMWIDYRQELKNLDKLKGKLFSDILTEIRGCFEGLTLHLYSYYDLPANDYEISSIPLLTYDLLIGLESGQKGYDKYTALLDWLRSGSHIIESVGDAIWSEFVRVPLKDRDLLKAGVDKFTLLFEDIDRGRFYKRGSEITDTVKALKLKRQKILNQLQKLLRYTSFPGECEYLR